MVCSSSYRVSMRPVGRVIGTMLMALGLIVPCVGFAKNRSKQSPIPTVSAQPVQTDVKPLLPSLFNPNIFGVIEGRQIGPATSSGRISAIEALYLDTDASKTAKKLVIYVGTAGGGVWKSKDNGTTFKAIFDKEKYQSIGAIALDPRHQDSVVWVGTGESNMRNSVSIGGGLYKSTDAGESWKLMGLEQTEHIAKIAINPKNPDEVFVAVPGPLWGDSPHRGLYKTSDGGKTFEKIFYVNEKTGCADIAIDPSNPQIMYATMWEFRRKAYSFESGGSGSGFYKSTDGGKTWNKLTKDLPTGDYGRCVVTIAPSHPNVVYAIVEAKESAMYKSSDRGESWTRLSNALPVVSRPFYFSTLVIDPVDTNRVYRPSFQLGVSTDGGKTFNGFEYGGGNHPDHHALWIDPINPAHLLLGTDGGVYRSLDRGTTWSQFRNLPVGQFYHVSYDMMKPYNVMGGLQDNGAWLAPSRTPGGIQNRNWESTGFGDGFYVVRDRENPDYIYFSSQGGFLARRRVSTNEVKPIQPFEELGEKKLRWNWNAPLVQSPTNKKRLYAGSQYVHRTMDKGETWERISPDLTTNDSTKYDAKTGGVTADKTSAENHCTIYTIAESSLDEKIIWAGTDDGNLHITRDGGKKWEKINTSVLASLPQGTWVSYVEPSRYDKAVAYATFENHMRGDMNPYIYKTADFGKTWTRLMHDSLRGFAHVIREDIVNKNLLFAGTELGLFVSIDGGISWAQFKNEFPSTPVRDITIHPRDHDVICATHGRGIIIIDDLVSLRALSAETINSDVVILPTDPVVTDMETSFADYAGNDEYIGGNPVSVAQVMYYMKSRMMSGELKIEILDNKSTVLATLTPTKRKGINRVIWGMRGKAPKVAASSNFGGVSFGPIVEAGTYTVRITKNDKVYTGTIQLVDSDAHSSADRKLRRTALSQLFTLQEDIAYLTEIVAAGKTRAEQAVKAMEQDKATSEKLSSYLKQLTVFHSALVADKNSLFADSEDKLRERASDLYGSVMGYAGHPGAVKLDRLKNLRKEVDELTKKWNVFTGKELVEMNSVLTAKNLQPLSLLPRAEFDKREQ